MHTVCPLHLARLHRGCKGEPWCIKTLLTSFSLNSYWRPCRPRQQELTQNEPCETELKL